MCTSNHRKNRIEAIHITRNPKALENIQVQMRNTDIEIALQLLPKSIYTYEILNSFGAIISRETIDTSRQIIDCKGFVSGVYLLNIYRDTSLLHSSQIVIEALNKIENNY